MKTVLRSVEDFWMWSPESGWDLSHPKPPHSEPVTPRLHLNCYISDIAIDSSQTALVILDMQNLSLSGALKSDLFPAVYQAQDALLRYAIPAARRAKIQVIWLNWGLTEKDFSFMNTETLRVFDWRANSDAADYCMSIDDAMSLDGYIGCGERPRSTGLCVDLAEIHMGDRTEVGAGRVLYEGNVDRSFARSARVCFQRRSGGIPA